ncbi:hypothetical protein MUB24_01085 [Lederbergia sp. NSJ-179]|uniref:hypothetical protein n=1 Tax=Lederbergia sp. NSJ-179 TaxID=2931402 RepID=UPI001FCFE7B3|nr:hypothetical protein [Lederbergia sp. NSJ-179]MCJ7839522.1 hypothetical protein [Lederbergia sp. NSJ-179]
MNNPIPQIPDFQVCRVGSAPVIRQLIDKLGLIDRIDQLSPVKKEDVSKIYFRRRLGYV